MTREVPILNLEEVSVLATSQSPAIQYFHTFGLFKQECQTIGGVVWILYDEIKEVSIRLGGSLSEYPRPKPGDVIRVHRLKINKLFQAAEIVNPRNVLIWPGFRHDPQPLSVARAPSIGDEDNRRRRILEVYFTSRIQRIEEFQTNLRPQSPFFNVAGRVEGFNIDLFGHLEINFTDGTGHCIMRVFAKKADNEVETHFEAASKFKVGDYFVASNVKLDMNGKRLNLSANEMHGRSLRQVEKSSILGAMLSEKLDNITTEIESAEPAITTTIHATPLLVDVPSYTPFSELKPRDTGYQYHDIVGQVREEPHPTGQFGNYVMQIYDGSLHNLVSFHSNEVKHLMEGCLVLFVYSKQKESDIDEHIEMAKKIKEADLIFVRNVRVSFKSGKVKLELSANKTHNKSIKVIDKDSVFGRKLLDIVETPPVEELREMIDPTTSSQE